MPAEDADERDVGAHRVAAHVHGRAKSASMWNGSLPATWRSKTSSIARATSCGRRSPRRPRPRPRDRRPQWSAQEDEVAPAVAGRRVADDERAKLGDLHAVSAPVVTGGATRPRAANGPAPRASCRAPATSPRPQRTTFGNRDPYAEHSLTSSARTCDNQPIRAELDSTSRTELGAPLALREGVDAPPVEIAAYAGTSE